MKRILVTGASGFLGWNLFQQRTVNVAWIGTYHRNRVEWPDAHLIEIDLTHESETEAMLDKVRPESVIHTAAISDANWCEEHPGTAYQINVNVPAHLARNCHKLGCRFVFVSTDLVFDGTAAPYTPKDTVNPLSTYGAQKAQAELLVRKACPQATIVRAPLMYGEDGPASSNHLSNLLKQWKAGHEIHLFTDEFRTPADGASVARGLYLATQHPGQTLHLGGPERLSRYAFGRKVADAFGLSAMQLKPIRQMDLDLPALRPKDVSLDSTMAFELGYKPSPIDETLTLLAANWP